MNLLFLWLTLFQLANGQIAITLVNENDSPLTQENIEFLTENQQVLARCVTNSLGRCTITIENAPTDASGFIRGSLSINDHGQRPLLWPGGQIEVQLVLEDGKLRVPSDAYVTRTPKPEATPTAQEPLQATPTVQETLQATETIQEPLQATETVQEPLQATPAAQEQNGELPAWRATIFDSLFQIFLIFIMLIALALYIIKSKTHDNSTNFDLA